MGARRSFALSLGLSFALSLASGCLFAQSARGAEDPIEIADAHPVMTLHAEGVQIYECRDEPNGPAWTFREPLATLLRDGQTVGRHFAGPT